MLPKTFVHFLRHAAIALILTPVWAHAEVTATVYLDGLAATYTGAPLAPRAGTWGMVSTFAGAAGGPGSLDGVGSAAGFNLPSGIAVDGAGNVFVADTSNDSIRKVTPDGTVTTIAGKALASGFSDGNGSAARFSLPHAVAVDASGNLYVADMLNAMIRKITPDGAVTTLAGKARAIGTADGTGNAARFGYVQGIAVDGDGNVYVADTSNHTIRKISATDDVTTVTTLAGGAGIADAFDATGTAARFSSPRGLVVDALGNVYVADMDNCTIRKVTPGGTVTTIAGLAKTPDTTDGTGTAARFMNPSDITQDGAGNLYVVDAHAVRKITPDGTVTTLAGSTLSGGVDGTGSDARFIGPRGIAADSSGTVYVADTFNYQIRKVSAAGGVTTLAGTRATTGSQDGTGGAARFFSPSGSAVDSAGNVYIAEEINNTIRKISSAGVVTTLAGAAGYGGSDDGAGSAARFLRPTSVALDGAGNLYVADQYNHTIRKITPGGVVTTVAGTAGNAGTTDGDGTGTSARFNFPTGVAADVGGNLYVADTYNHVIRKITAAGAVTTLAGSPGLTGRDDGTGPDARFLYPKGVAVDETGHVYVADTSNHLIRKISPAGVVTSLAGGPGLEFYGGSNDGTGTAAQFNQPTGIAVDERGAVYVADTGNQTIRKITPQGAVTTIGGSVGNGNVVNGTGTAARFYYPTGVAVDGSGNLYVTDKGGQTVRKITGAGGTVNLTYNGSASTPTAAGSYSVVATLDDPNYTGSASGTFVISKASQLQPAIWSPSPIAFGTSYPPSITPGFGAIEWVLVTANSSPGTSIDPVTGVVGSTNTGTATIKARFAGDANHEPSPYSSNFQLTITAAPTAFALNQADFFYTGSAQGPTIYSVPGNATFTTGGTLSATAVGNYTATASATGNYSGSDSALNWTIAKAWQAAPVITSGSSINFGNPYVATVDASLGHGTIEWTLGASSTAANAAVNAGGVVSATTIGTVVIKARFSGNGNYLPSDYCADFAVTVTPIPVTFSLSASTLTYNGMPQSPVIVTTPAGVPYTTGGTTTASNYGNYTITAVATGVYSGSASLDWSIAKASQVITFSSPLPGSLDFTGAPIPLVATASSGLPVTFTVLSGPATISGANLLLSGTGSVVVRASQAGNGDYSAAPDVDRGLIVGNPYIVTTLAAAAGAGSADGTGIAAQFNTPNGVAVDGAGNVYVADTANHTVRKITPAGVVTTLAGSAGEAGYIDGTGSAARFWEPMAPTCDAAGNVYVFTSHQTIRKITPAGVVTTLAGKWDGGVGSADGTGSAARFYFATGLAVDSAGNVYAADYGNHTIRKITPGGVVTTLAGSAGNPGSIDGTGANARFEYPYSVTVGTDGNLYVADYGNGLIRKVTPTGEVTTLTDNSNGMGSVARFYQPRGVTADGTGNLYVADTMNHTIRKIVLSTGAVTTFAGSIGQPGFANGEGSAARFKQPWNVAIDAGGNVYVICFQDHQVRKITAAAVVSSFAGRPAAGVADGTGSDAQFQSPSGVASDSQGNVYVADTENHVIRKIAPNGAVSTLAGSPLNPGMADGPVGTARFNWPYGIAVDRADNVYVADTNNSAIRKITPSGVVTTFAIGLSAPTGLAFDAAGNLYVTESYSHAVRKITPAGVASLFAGTPNVAGSADGPAGTAQFYMPRGIAVDGLGYVYVADYFNHTIRKITPEGVVSTFSGAVGISGYDDGVASRYSLPDGIAVDGAGNLYVADYVGHRIRRLDAGGVATTIAGPLPLVSAVPGSVDGLGNDARFNRPRGLAVDGNGVLYVADTANHAIRKLARAPVFSVSSQPADQTVLVGTPASFAITVTGFPNRSYQWRKNGANITGAVASTYSIASAAKSDAAAYSVVVFNADGIVTSAPAELTVTGSAPSITMQPANATQQESATATFQTAATGTPTPSYQWQILQNGGSVWTDLVNGGPYTGAQTTALQVSNVSVAVDSGDQFRCVATNLISSSTSDAATLTVHPTVNGDFNGDGHPDIVLQNLTTGARSLRLMNGTTLVTEIDLGALAKEWSIAATADFNGDRQPDLLLQNSQTGERAIRLMNGTTAGADVSLGTVPVEWSIGAAADFNGDGKPDILWQNTTTGERSVWFMNGTAIVNGTSLGSVPVEWSIAAAADFNGDGKPDILWQNTTTGERSLWFMNGTTIISGTSLGSVPVEWFIAAATDFNGDGKPDILWQNTTTGQCYLWFMNGTDHITDADLGLLPAGWSLVGVPAQQSPAKTHDFDFNGDGKPDILWQNTSTGERSLWFMNGSTIISGTSLGFVPVEWSIVATADFNGDGKPDILWQNTTTGERSLWFMNGSTTINGTSLGFVPVEWSIGAAADFNGDGKTDILWQNTTTGERSFWFMNGTTTISGTSLGFVPVEWSIAAAADFNGDGKTDILWQNTTTGERSFWFMNGTTTISGTSLGSVPVEWSIAMAADFNGDGKTDILWQNATTGQRYLWFMNGTTAIDYADLGLVALAWHIVN